MWFVSGNQIVDGVPIYGTEVGFTLNASGEIVLLGADVYPAVELPTNPSLSASAALAAAKTAFSETGTAEVKSEPRLTILPMGDPVNFYLTWQLELYSMNPFQDIVYFVDAASGRILHSFNNIPQFDYAETDGHDSPLIGHVEPTAQTEIALMSSVPNMATASLATITITGRINGNYWPEAHTDPTATSGYPTTTIKLYNQLGQHITSFSTDRTGYYSVTYSMAPGIYTCKFHSRAPTYKSVIEVTAYPM